MEVIDLKYKFKVPIGDWSNDGHGKCDWYIIESSHSVEEVREMYFKACSEAGYNFVEEFCCDYGDMEITREQAAKIPFDIRDYCDSFNGPNDDLESRLLFYSDGFLALFLDWIKYYNPSFHWIVIHDDLDMLPFYGYDDKRRHIGFIGYGLFD